MNKVLPQNEDVIVALATLYEDSGTYDKSNEQFKQVLALDPKHIDALLGAGHPAENRPCDRSATTS